MANETTWDGASKIIQPMGDTVIAVAISRDERHFACGGADKKIAIYTCHTGQEHCTFATKAGWVEEESGHQVKWGAKNAFVEPFLHSKHHFTKPG